MCATLLSRGVHPKIVQEMLGHSSINMTMDLYSHVTFDVQQLAAVAAWDGMFTAPRMAADTTP